MYKIGELSKLSNLPIKTLRYYDSEGLLSPDYIDAFTGYRYYSAARLSDCYPCQRRIFQSFLRKKCRNWKS